MKVNSILIVASLSFITNAVFGQIPFSIKTTADSLIIAKLGNSFFNKVTYNCQDSGGKADFYFISDCPEGTSISNREKRKALKLKKQEKELMKDYINYFVLSYKFNLGSKASYGFKVKLDTNGHLRDSLEIPDCISKPELCDIKIDSVNAIQHAIQSGLEKGLGIYNKGIKYRPDTGTFLWEVINHLRTSPDQGETVFIYPLTGERRRNLDRHWLRSVVH